jgi:hypothetical protein
LLAHGQWFSPSIPVSSSTTTGRHDITEILLKVALNTINQIKLNQITYFSSTQYDFLSLSFTSWVCHDLMVVGFTITCAISAYHH